VSAVSIVTQLLLQHHGVAQWVDQAVYPVEAPQECPLPFIVIRLVAESSDYALTGTTGGFDARVEVSCHARTFSACDALGEMVKGALSDVVNQAVTYDDESPPTYLGAATIWKTATDVSDVSSDRKTYRRVMDFRVRHWFEGDDDAE
jgi:hypothetical protein